MASLLCEETFVTLLHLFYTSLQEIVNSINRKVFNVFYEKCHKAQMEHTMLDFYKISSTKKGTTAARYYEVGPDFQVKRFKDLMVRGGAFYAIWNQKKGLWSTDEYDVQALVDAELREHAEKLVEEQDLPVTVKYMQGFGSSSWSQFRLFLSRIADNYEQLDATIAFSNTEVVKTDHISKRLSYPLEEGETPAFDNLFGTLYDEENLTKLLWAIGSVFAGDSKLIQKFYVLFGLPGTGKSTSLNLIEKLLGEHVSSFEASLLTNASSTFALDALKNNPLVAIDHEGDLSKIRNNSVLTSVVSHDRIVINVKYQHPFSIKLNTSLFVATNKPVMITDRGSGLIRRLVDIRPSGMIVSPRDYESLVNQIDFELSAIAVKCLEVYKQLGRNHYNNYLPLDMMYRTNIFFNFIDEYYYEFVRDDFTTLTKAWAMYKQFCEETGIVHRLARHAFRDELKNYWKKFDTITRVGGVQTRSVYRGFLTSVFNKESSLKKGEPVVYDWLALSEQPSIFDREHEEQPAQLAGRTGTPQYKWDNVTNTLSDVKTEKLHYVLPKSNLITLDFDLKDDEGEKSLELNIAAARNMPPTYAETSKSGVGLHLHYYYDGDVSKLGRVYSPGVEVLRPVGNFSIRRQLSTCNDHMIATINSGLPLKPERGTNMVSKKTISNERALRSLIVRNLQKDIHPATKPSVDFIDTILAEAYDQGLRYDVTDLRPHILDFASKSTNHGPDCVKKALGMKYESKHEEPEEMEEPEDPRLVFFDLEVFPNLLLVCWKYEGSDNVVRMFDPTSSEIESLMKMRLVGFNNRRYDNHILFGRYLGYDSQQIYNLSKRIISGDRDAYFREAYSISHTDIYDYATIKKSLKHWQVDLGIFHSEMEHDWDAPLPEDLWEMTARYCENDVISTEAVHNHRIEDYHARQILAELSGLSANHTTMAHTSKIVFGNRRDQKNAFEYPDLAEEFPGYVYDKGVSTYRDETVGEGGYVYSEPGMYNNVLYMDIASMHPTSIEVMNLFGPYTESYSRLKEARLLIKEGRPEAAGKLLGITIEASGLEGLSYALKIALNIVYGFTAARFDNPFRDVRNRDNVVAKRGALFMIDLKHALQTLGCNPIHFKTDSVKIASYEKGDIEFIQQFGEKYGYTFSVEGVYEKFVLINDAVSIGKINNVWDAVGARFARPYVYKTLFSKEPIEFDDLTETRSVKKGTIYIETAEGMTFIGRVGMFCPMKTSGGILYRVQGDKNYAVTGTKGYKWLPAEVVRELGKEDDIDMSYFEAAVDEALEKIAAFGDPNIFIGE